MGYPHYVVAKKNNDPESLFQRTAGAPECGILHQKLPSIYANSPAELLNVADHRDRIVRVRGETPYGFICELTHEVVNRFGFNQLRAM